MTTLRTKVVLPGAESRMRRAFGAAQMSWARANKAAKLEIMVFMVEMIELIKERAMINER